ncbi:MAG: hypothetical protein K2O08_00130 [Clostridia bacterium]|nr:hypothetical protein [Clostridia bacterium]
MKKFVKSVFIIPIIIIISIVLLIVGGVNRNDTLFKAGTIILTVAIPITMVIMVGVGLVLMITGKSDDNDNDKTKDDAASEREKEYNELKDVNTSYRYDNKVKESKYIARHAAKNYKNSTNKEKVFGWVFLSFLLSNIILTILFGFFNIKLGAIICFSLFVGTIIIAIIVNSIKEKISMSAKVYTKSKDREMVCGKVKNCLLSSTRSVGGGHGNSTSRITKVVYKVTVTAEEKDYIAFSEDFYEVDEPVVIAKLGGHRAAIVDIDKLREETQEKIKNLLNNND